MDIATYTHTYADSKRIIEDLKEHKCDDVNFISYNHVNYIGFKCQGCNQSWGVHYKHLKRENKIGSYIKLTDPNKVIEILKFLNTKLSTEVFIERYKRNFINYAAYLEVLFVRDTDTISDWEKLSQEDKDKILIMIRDAIIKEYPLKV
jgi:hypothetical protein